MRLSGFRLPLPRLSATSLSTFTACPEQFRQKYLLHTEETMSGDRFMGIVVHKALDEIFKGDPTAPIEELAEESVADAWNDAIEKDGEPEWYDLDASKEYKRARLMIKTYLPYAQQQTVVATEERFEETICGVPVIGYIDRRLPDRILEVKTAKNKVSKPKNRWQFQGRLYGLVSALPIEWHVVTRQVTPQVVTAAEAPELYVPRYNPDVTIRLVQQAIERMNDLYARHGANEPWPLDGIHGDWSCNYCSFKKKGCIAWT